MYEAEKATVGSMKKELQYYQRQMKEAQLAREDAKKVRAKLVSLKNVETLIKGNITNSQNVNSCVHRTLKSVITAW